MNLKSKIILAVIGLSAIFGYIQQATSHSQVAGLQTTAPTATPTPTNTPTPTVTPTLTPTPTPLYHPQPTQQTYQQTQPATTNGSIPAGATAHCADGTYSFSLNHRGTCSHHGGVVQWY